MENERYFERRREQRKAEQVRRRINKRNRISEAPESPRRIVASFNRAQLQEVYDWMGETSANYPQMGITEALETIEGRDERKRFGYGIKALLEIGHLGKHLTDVRDVLVWEEGSGQVSVEARYFSRNNSK